MKTVKCAHGIEVLLASFWSQEGSVATCLCMQVYWERVLFSLFQYIDYIFIYFKLCLFTSEKLVGTQAVVIGLTIIPQEF